MQAAYANCNVPHYQVLSATQGANVTKVHLRARYYSPEYAMFLSRGPVEGVLARPMSRNGYSYAENSIVNWSDPSGEFLNILAGAFIGAGIGAESKKERFGFG